VRFSRGLGVVGAAGGFVYSVQEIDHYVATKYSRKGLKKVVKQYFGDVTLGQRVKHTNHDENNQVQLLITTCMSKSRKPLLFDSLAHEGGLPFDSLNDPNVSIEDILLSTSAAPTYFSPYRLKPNLEVVDGGVCFNNPALLGFTRARSFWRGDKVHVLSLGTGYSLQTENLGSGVLGSKGKAFVGGDIVQALFQTQSYGTHKFLEMMKNNVRVAIDVAQIENALAQHAIALLPPSQQGFAVQMQYEPLESYARVDGVLPCDIELDGVNLLRAGQTDPFTESADKFIKEANAEDHAFDRFIDKMKEYHGLN
jgi:hypothetical protein